MTTSKRQGERRITVLASIYPRLQAWAEQDGITVADVVNAILLQSIQPYGCHAFPANSAASHPMGKPLPPCRHRQDQYPTR